MKKKYKWGILATGKMAAKFVRALKLLDNAELHSVGSRDLSRAKIFAEEFGFKKEAEEFWPMPKFPEPKPMPQPLKKRS